MNLETSELGWEEPHWLALLDRVKDCMPPYILAFDMWRGFYLRSPTSGFTEGELNHMTAVLVEADYHVLCEKDALYANAVEK